LIRFGGDGVAGPIADATLRPCLEVLRGAELRSRARPAVHATFSAVVGAVEAARGEPLLYLVWEGAALRARTGEAPVVA